MAARPIPEGFHTLTPQLTVKDALRAIEFYKQAFGAEVRGIYYAPDGRKT
jgi:PhnB protein